MSDQQTEITPQNLPQQPGLWKGGYGLPVTFWVWGVFGSMLLGFIISVVVSISESRPSLNICALAFELYTAFVAIATFRAASQFEAGGPWKILAQLFVLAWLALVSLACLYFLAMINSQYPNH